MNENANLETSERALLGLMILDPSAIDRASKRLSGLSFADDARGRLFATLVDLREAGQPTNDVAALIPELQRRKLLFLLGGTTGIGKLTIEACLITSLDVLCNEIERAADHRRLIDVRDRFSDLLETDADPNELREWLSIQATSGQELSSSDKPELIADVIERLAKQTDDGTSNAIKSGIYSLDCLTGGFRAGQLVVIGARPSVGKSALGFQFARHAAEFDNRAMYVSIEMPNDELGARRIAGDCEIQLSEIMAGKLDKEQRRRMFALAANLRDTPLLLWETNAPTVERIVAMMRCEVANGLRLAVVDYVSLIRHRDAKKPHWERIGDVTRALKATAKHLRIPIILLAQVGRDVEKGSEAKRPTLADLKYSGDLEQDADLVLFVHRQRMERDTELILAKGRNCELGVVHVKYDGPRYTFTETINATEWTG